MARIEGLKQLKKQISKLEKMPTKQLSKATRKGANIVLKEARRRAPVEEGNLKKGIVLRAERNRKKGKKVFDVRMDSKMNDVFVKTSKEGKRSYYPTSQEYGYFAKNGRYIPGFRFMRGSLQEKKAETEKTIVTELSREIDKLTGGG